MALSYTFNAIIGIGSNKHVDAARVFSQDIIGTTPHKYTGFFFSQLANYVALYFKESFVAQIIIRVNFAVDVCAQTQQTSEETMTLFFVGFFEEFFSQSTFFRSNLYQFFIVKANSKFCSQLFANCPTTTSELSTDIYYKLFIHDDVF